MKLICARLLKSVICCWDITFRCSDKLALSGRIKTSLNKGENDLKIYGKEIALFYTFTRRYSYTPLAANCDLSALFTRAEQAPKCTGPDQRSWKPVVENQLFISITLSTRYSFVTHHICRRPQDWGLLRNRIHSKERYASTKLRSNHEVMAKQFFIFKMPESEICFKWP